MADNNVSIDIPGLGKLVDYLYKLLSGDAAARAIAAKNAPRVALQIPNFSITGNTVWTITSIPGVSGISRPFSSMSIVFDETSGSGRLSLNQSVGAAVGPAIPAGFSSVDIEGNDNIVQFQMMAQAGQTLTGSGFLFT